MDDNTTLQLAVVVAFVAVAVGFVIFAASGGFLGIAIDRAIEDGRVVPGMTKDDVVASWGWPTSSRENETELMGLNEFVASTWTYGGRSCEVYFGRDGQVTLVVCDSND